MADNVLESGPPSAKRPKLSSPALSVSASDGNGKYAACIYYLDVGGGKKKKSRVSPARVIIPGQLWKSL